jgi:hypothetical protein
MSGNEHSKQLSVINPKAAPVAQFGACAILDYYERQSALDGTLRASCCGARCFFDGDAADMRGFHAMNVADCFLKLLNIVHTVASTRSPTLEKSCSTPAAIAGVQRSELCRFT